MVPAQPTAKLAQRRSDGSSGIRRVFDVMIPRRCAACPAAKDDI